MQRTLYKKIPTLVENDLDLGNGKQILRNNRGFCLGDKIVIQELLDGHFASIEKDTDPNSDRYGQIVVCSKDKILGYNNKMYGFFDYAEDLNSSLFRQNSNFVIFGQWVNDCETVKYEDPYLERWYIFDIYDKDVGKYLKQSNVKEFCEDYNLDYVNVLYDGKFAGWNLVHNYLDRPRYGNEQLGIVVKNQDRLNSVYKGVASDLKIIDPKFLLRNLG